MPTPCLPRVARQLGTGRIIPYLGPGLAALSKPVAPMTPEALAAFFATKVALPRRAKGNAWASAQHIESAKHRSTVLALMSEAFAPPVAPTALHLHLATLRLPMIVDTWYDGAMRAALHQRQDWGEIQGITRAGIGEDRWYRFYDAAGAEAGRAAAETWTTLLYKPHGSICAGQELPDLRRRLCRGADGNRHPNPDPGRRAGAGEPGEISSSSVAAFTTRCCGLMRGRSPSDRRPRIMRLSNPKRSPRMNVGSWWPRA